jgi:glycolate oxidase iron-sulfur subunit
MIGHTPPESLSSPHFRQLLNQCVHCGLCLPACPTYAIFGTEMESPRGRIALMNAAAEGRVPLDGTLRRHIESCLACRACEPACPSGVRYGLLVETTRNAVEANRTPGIFERTVRRVALRELLPQHGRLRSTARVLRLYQTLGLPALARRVPLPARLRAMSALLPPLPEPALDYRQPAPAMGHERGVVSFFRGCIQDAFLPHVNAATVRVLQCQGYRVEFPLAQTCCGAAQLHVGEESLACALARQNIDAFSAGDYIAIINNAGGCGAVLSDYARLLQGDPAYAEKAARFSRQVKDISEFLAEHLNVAPRRAVQVRATYVDSCHLRNVQRIMGQPRDLLRAIRGVELVELESVDRCCGSAGVYNIVQPDTANVLLDSKMTDIAATGADTIVVANTGCYLQMLNGVRRAGLHARVVHLVELLDQAYAE